MYKNLISCKLFANITANEIAELFEIFDIQTKSYAMGDIIALEGKSYTQLLILTQGQVQAESTDYSNKVIAVEKIIPTSLIAPSFLFADDPRLPTNLVAKSEVTLVYIDKSTLCKMMSQNRTMMCNFMNIMSSQNHFVSENVMYLTYKNIKSKYSNYLLNKMNQTGSNSFRNDLTQREMAEMFGVTRPALARAIKELADEGAIYVKGKEVTLLYPEKLQQYTRNN